MGRQRICEIRLDPKSRIGTGLAPAVQDVITDFFKYLKIYNDLIIMIYRMRTCTNHYII